MNLFDVLNNFIQDNSIHAKWLNTLSMMENCGARKISACEHSQDVDIIVLKHAAEEARHAYFLKAQIKKLGVTNCKTYRRNEILAPVSSYQYLHQLDVKLSRYLKDNFDYHGSKLKYASYLLTTYAIEVRADELYPVYAEALKANSSNINVRMIIAEEKGHLEEMIAQMEGFFEDWETHAKFSESIEQVLYDAWFLKLKEEALVLAE
ncbi:MAG: hypothetical protein ACI8U0_001705 [Flavobacteriales bacterium]|jgi:hypothetical protein